MPNVRTVSSIYTQILNEFIENEIQPRVDEITYAIRQNANNLMLVNKLGVLYARFGLLDKAMLEFINIIEQKEDINALTNMGNIWFLKQDFQNALDYYNRAYKIAPDNPKVIITASYATAIYLKEIKRKSCWIT